MSDFTDMPLFETLKKHILSLIRPNKKGTFGIYDPSLYLPIEAWLKLFKST